MPTKKPEVWHGHDLPSELLVLGTETPRFYVPFMPAAAGVTPESRGEPNGATVAMVTRRLTKPIQRAFGRAHGARATLRGIVKPVVREMLAGGATPAAAVRTIERCIVDHAACQRNDPRSILTGKLESTMLVDLMRGWVAEVVAG